MSPTELSQRAAVINEAKTWLGTNFHHRGRIRIVRNSDGTILDRGGVDCAQSVYLIYREAIPDKIPKITAADEAYAFQWNLSRETAGVEGYLTTVLKYATEIERNATKPGDLVLFRIAHAWAHGAIIMPPAFPSIAHASSDDGGFVISLATQGRLSRTKMRFFTLWGAS